MDHRCAVAIAVGEVTRFLKEKDEMTIGQSAGVSFGAI